MLDKTAREVLITELDQVPARIESALKGVSASHLGNQYREGSWTVRQLVHHLADAHMNGFIRTKLGLTEDQPTIKPYNQVEWSKLPDAQQPIEESLMILRGLHARWTALLRTLTDEEWSRTFFHPERGRMSLEDLLQLYAAHGTKHIDHIRAALAR